jgi:acyloxyacyl hydrolase
MTTVEQFRKNIIRLLDYLDTTVPNGSHLFILGLGDGDILYDNLHN